MARRTHQAAKKQQSRRQNVQDRDLISKLPLELHLEIFKNLDQLELRGPVNRVSRLFHRVVQAIHPKFLGLSPGIWTNISRRVNATDLRSLAGTCRDAHRLIMYSGDVKIQRNLFAPVGYDRKLLLELKPRNVRLHPVFSRTFFRLASHPDTWCWRRQMSYPSGVGPHDSRRYSDSLFVANRAATSPPCTKMLIMPAAGHFRELVIDPGKTRRNTKAGRVIVAGSIDPKQSVVTVGDVIAEIRRQMYLEIRGHRPIEYPSRRQCRNEIQWEEGDLVGHRFEYCRLKVVKIEKGGCVVVEIQYQPLTPETERDPDVTEARIRGRAVAVVRRCMYVQI